MTTNEELFFLKELFALSVPDIAKITGVRNACRWFSLTPLTYRAAKPRYVNKVKQYLWAHLQMRGETVLPPYLAYRDPSTYDRQPDFYYEQMKNSCPKKFNFVADRIKRGFVYPNQDMEPPPFYEMPPLQPVESETTRIKRDLKAFHEKVSRMSDDDIRVLLNAESQKASGLI